MEMIVKGERKSLEYFLGLKYPVTIIPDESGGFVAEIVDLPGCFTQGETLEEVFKNMEEARRLWLEVAYEDGLDIPLPPDTDSYSGKFNVRVTKTLHRKLGEAADREGVSLNHLIVTTLSHAVGVREGRASDNSQSR